jgi:hypothetical protein
MSARKLVFFAGILTFFSHQSISEAYCVHESWESGVTTIPVVINANLTELCAPGTPCTITEVENTVRSVLDMYYDMPAANIRFSYGGRTSVSAYPFTGWSPDPPVRQGIDFADRA